ncbi:MAG: S16 family serine protease [Candidatus Aenigmatarchaeota archaeon]
MEESLKIILIAIVLLIVLSLASNLTLKSIILPNVTVGERTKIILSNESILQISMNIPAVDEEGNGVITKLMVEAKPGTGRVLVDINQLLFWVDTQNSIRVAQKVAQNYTNTDLSSIDLIYSIETNASLIGGPSAGAAMTVATIALLENKSLNKSVMMTGTINSDGTIGPVGEIVSKAKAAKDVGAKLFLVPEGQAVQTYYKPVEHCERFGPVTYCSTEYKPEKIDVSKEVGIPVKEVSTIQEALKYFLE